MGDGDEDHDVDDDDDEEEEEDDDEDEEEDHDDDRPQVYPAPCQWNDLEHRHFWDGGSSCFLHLC